MSRNLDFRYETFQPYTKALGELTLAWNDFNMVLSHVFWAVSKIPNGMVPYAMWNSLNSDRVQREMLLAVIKLEVIGHNIPKNIRCEFEWVLSKANSLEDFRNDALHSPLFGVEDDVFAWHQLGHKRAAKLANKDLLKEYGWFYDTIIILRDYTNILRDALTQPDEPLPGRPSLPNRGDTSALQSRPKAQTTKRLPQPQS